jgi:hypothetical protein
MRWDLYLNQTQGAGRVTLAVFLVCFGVMSWWYMIQRLPWLETWRPRLTTGFWILVGLMCFTVTGLIFFAWPEVVK